eukprot:TRINITY_DN17203_c0_g1_i2.p1 TRINITY_DN17203_c0_g1~~TRINITY_DN17203_c0_g1_i2.p1  ORF type:complete len:123 (-),score=2.71 TRINITY_DN17203_c0_g1_i2:17-385(-)
MSVKLSLVRLAHPACADVLAIRDARQKHGLRLRCQLGQPATPVRVRKPSRPANRGRMATDSLGNRVDSRVAETLQQSDSHMSFLFASSLKCMKRHDGGRQRQLQNRFCSTSNINNCQHGEKR